MAFKNVSKDVIKELRDACDRILAGEQNCGHDDQFVTAIGINEECSEIARVEIYSEFDIQGPEHQLPLRDALKIVAAHVAMAAWDHNIEGLEGRLQALAKSNTGSPLMWKTGQPMQLNADMVFEAK